MTKDDNRNDIKENYRNPKYVRKVKERRLIRSNLTKYNLSEKYTIKFRYEKNDL